MGARFSARQTVTDKYVDDLRTSWTQRPFDLTGEFSQGENLVVLPQPGRKIPIWIGGMGPRAIRRALSQGDGWHGYGPVDEVCSVARQLRAGRPQESFTLSNRVDWDGLTTKPQDIGQQLEAFTDAGVEHIVACPSQSNTDDWLRSVEALARTFALI